MKKLIFSFAHSLAAVSAPVAAQTTTGAIAVNHSDLALSTPAGIEALDARIAHAVRLACGFDKSERNLAITVQQKQCLAAKQAEISASRQAAIAAATATPRTLAAR
jgi:UrcA family protein